MAPRISRSKPDVGSSLCFSASYGSSNARLAVGGEDCCIRIFHPDEAYRRSNVVISSAMTEKNELKMPITAVRFRPKDTSNVLLAATCDGSLSFWHVGAMKLVHSIRDGPEGNGTYAADYSPSGALLATGGTDGTVRIYDATLGNGQLRVLSELSEGPTAEEPRAHPTRIQSVRFANDHVVLSGGWDRVVRVWDVRCGEGQNSVSNPSSSSTATVASRRPVSSIRGPYMAGDGLDVCGNYVVCASSERYENQLEIFDLRRPEDAVCSVTLASRVDGVAPPSLYCAKFNPQNSTQVAVGGTHFYGIFEIASGCKMAKELSFEETAGAEISKSARASEEESLKPNMFCASWTSDGRSCLFAGRGALVVEV